MNKQQTVTEKHNKHLMFIREITRQLCHPKTGLPKDLSPPPATLGDWKKCLDSLYGWVNIGIEQNMAEMFHELNIGEVIPSTPPNMDIYNFGFAPNEIGKLLGMEKKDKDYRAIINYYSFSRMVGILMNSQCKDYCIKFNESLKSVFTDANPKTFWINILVDEITANYLKSNKIGEVIVKEGTSGGSAMLESSIKAKNGPVIWDMGDTSDSESDNETKSDDKKVDKNKQFPPNYHLGDIEELSPDETSIMSDIDLEELEEFSSMKVTDEKESLKDNIIEATPFRLVMNNTTLLNIIHHSCYLNGNTNDNINVFQLMGGENVIQEEEFTDLFGKLQI